MRSLVGFFVLLLGVETLPAEACFQGPAAPAELVRRANVIVRVRAVDVVSDSVRFLILEQLKGDERLFDLAVRGSIVSYPDFNDRHVPYGFVRSGGRGGGCFAETYQRGGEYLMILKRTQGEMTPYWMALSPTNEQVRGADDSWVVWVRKELEQGPPPLPPARFRLNPIDPPPAD